MSIGRLNPPNVVKKTKSTKNPNTMLLVILGGLALVLGYVVFTSVDLKSLLPAAEVDDDSQTETVKKDSVRARPSPRPLTQGKETYKYAPGPLAVGPKISEFSLDPMDPKKGQRQIITVKASYTSAITSVTAKLSTDNKTQDVVFTRIDGTDKNGTWQATRTEDDTHDYTYYLDFSLVSSPDTYKGGFAFR